MRVVAAAICTKEEKVLITKREAQAQYGGYWEFPGGKLEANESPEDALMREMREELGIDVVVGRIFEVIHHGRDALETLVLFYRCEWTGGTPQALGNDGFAWRAPYEIQLESFLPQDAHVLQRLCDAQKDEQA